MSAQFIVRNKDMLISNINYYFKEWQERDISSYRYFLGLLKEDEISDALSFVCSLSKGTQNKTFYVTPRIVVTIAALFVSEFDLDISDEKFYTSYNLSASDKKKLPMFLYTKTDPLVITDDDTRLVSSPFVEDFSCYLSLDTLDLSKISAAKANNVFDLSNYHPKELIINLDTAIRGIEGDNNCKKIIFKYNNNSSTCVNIDTFGWDTSTNDSVEEIDLSSLTRTDTIHLYTFMDNRSPIFSNLKRIILPKTLTTGDKFYVDVPSNCADVSLIGGDNYMIYPEEEKVDVQHEAAHIVSENELLHISYLKRNVVLGRNSGIFEG